jgi:hypothetical protein
LRIKGIASPNTQIETSDRVGVAIEAKELTRKRLKLPIDPHAFRLDRHIAAGQQALNQNRWLDARYRYRHRHIEVVEYLNKRARQNGV